MPTITPRHPDAAEVPARCADQDMAYFGGLLGPAHLQLVAR